MSNTPANKAPIQDTRYKIRNTKVLLSVIVVVLVLNTLVLLLFRQEIGTRLLGTTCNNTYSFINPRYRCGQKDTIDKKGYAELKTELKTYTEKKKAEGKASVVGIWFRDLESGPTFGINDRIDFIPASLLKLPLAMTYFDIAGDDPSILERMISTSDIISDVPMQTFKPIDPIVKGKAYTILQLIEHTLTHSDNVAAQLLYEYHQKNFKNHPLLHTYRDLGILEPGSDLNKAAVNTKSYGSIFRLLYNTSFLDKDASEQLLAMLAKSEFQDGLVKGIPEGIVVAHKFGERFLESGEKQLHDCGIIYYPGNPYQLCVMTRGNNYNDLKIIIGEISKQVYQEFNSRNITNQ